MPHPNPHLFTSKKRLYRLTTPSPSSRSSFMSSLSDGTQKRARLRKTRPTSGPVPEIQPLFFEQEPIIDKEFFALHHTTDAKDDVRFFTPTTTLDRNLKSQPSYGTHSPHAIISGASQSISPTAVNSNLSLPMLSKPSNAINTATGQLESNSRFFDNLFCSNPFGYISRKLTKRRPTICIPRSVSTPLIPSSLSATPVTIPNPKLTPMTPSPNPSSPPLLPTIPLATNGLGSVIHVTDNPIFASSTVVPQHAPQSTFQCDRFQTENDNPTSIHLQDSNRIVHTPAIAPAFETSEEFLQFPQEPKARLENSVNPELASAIPAGVTEEARLRAPAHIGDRAFSSKHSHISGSSSSFQPTTLSMREKDLEATKRLKTRQEFEAIPKATGPSAADKEDIDEGKNATVHSKTDEGTETNGTLPTFEHSTLYSQSQDLQSNGRVSVTPPALPMMTTMSSSHGRRRSSSGCCGGRNRTSTPSTSGEDEGSIGESSAVDVLASQEMSLGSKPVGSGLMSLAKWKWKKGLSSMGEEETMANNPAVIHEFEPSTAQGGDGLPRGRSRSSRVNCEASQLISSSTSDKSAVTITQVTAFTSLLGSVVRSERRATETSVVAVMNADNAQQFYKSIKTKSKPKFTIGDLDEGTVEFPVSYTSTEVRDESEREELEHSNASPLRLPLFHKDAITDEGPDYSVGRRWTLASALTDEKISNDGLVKALDMMRDDSMGKEDEEVRLDALDVEKELLERWGTGIPDVGGRDGSREDVTRILDEVTERGHAELRESPVAEYESYPFQPEISPSPNSNTIDRGAHPKSMKQHIRSSSTPSHAWLAAQRALLTCRELILTERHYIAQLSALVLQHTVTPPPPLMCDCAKELLQASEHVLRGMEKDPSARGVAKAFLEGEEAVQGAYLRWCGVVGGWFSGDRSGQDGSASVGRSSLDLSEVGNRVRQLSVKRRNRVGSKTDVDKPSPPVKGSEEEDVSMNSLKRTVSTWRKSMPTLGFEPPPLYGGGDRKKEKEHEREAASPSTKIPAVRELAILPTQRVMRYPLIYQELLSHTPPTSPSWPFVERAAHAASRIAEKCDLAQGNAAFIASPPNGSVSRTMSSIRSDIQASPSKVPLLRMTLAGTEPLACETVPASPISLRSAVDPPSRSYAQYFQSANNKSNTELMTSSRRLSVSFGWAKNNKQKIPPATENM